MPHSVQALEAGGARLWVSAVARSGREKSLRNAREKRKGALQPAFSVPLLASAGPCTVCSWASFCPQSPCLPGQGHASGPCGGDTGTVWGRDQTPAWEGSRGLGGQPGSSRGRHCSAGPSSSSVRDVRAPNEWQEQSTIKPFRRGVERQPLASLLVPWVRP